MLNIFTNTGLTSFNNAMRGIENINLTDTFGDLT
jgi:hypothetical protein